MRVGNIMTRKEMKRFVEIAKLVNAVWKVQEDNPYEDVKSKVYGKTGEWSKTGEDHIHESSDIINIDFQDGGIIFYSDRWKNAKGEQISGILGILPGDFEVEVNFGWVKRHKKFEYTVTMGWSKCHGYKDKLVSDYVYKIQDKVLHYLIDNFDCDKVRADLRSVKSEISKKEFGLALENSYCMAKPEYNSVMVYNSES